jgi:hypothetical protein
VQNLLRGKSLRLPRERAPELQANEKIAALVGDELRGGRR